MKFLDIALVILLSQPVLISALDFDVGDISKCTVSMQGDYHERR
jgi:hypothetical protein